MSKTPKYFMVEADALPEVFRRVVQAKSLLERGEEATVNDAARAVGISRSAYYKYKDAVRPFQDMLHGRIVTFQILLKDEPGALSAVLSAFAGSGGNILTINQNIPINGIANITVSLRTGEIEKGIADIIEEIEQMDMVRRIKLLARE